MVNTYNVNHKVSKLIQTKCYAQTKGYRGITAIVVTLLLLISLLTYFNPRADPGFEVRGGANGLENLGRCKMDWKIEKKKKKTGGIVNIFQIYDYHSIYISITIYFKYDFFITILYILSPLIQ